MVWFTDADVKAEIPRAPVIIETAVAMETPVATDIHNNMAETSVNNIYDKKRNGTRPEDGKNTQTVGLYEPHVATAVSEQNQSGMKPGQNHSITTSKNSEDVVSSVIRGGQFLTTLKSLLNTTNTSGIDNPVSGEVIWEDENKRTLEKTKGNGQTLPDIPDQVEDGMMSTVSSVAQGGTTTKPCNVTARTTKSLLAVIVTRVRATPVNKKPDNWGWKAGKCSNNKKFYIVVFSHLSILVNKLYVAFLILAKASMWLAVQYK